VDVSPRTRRTPILSSLLSKKLGRLHAELRAEESGRESRQERGLRPRIDLGKELCMLLSEEPDKELSSFLAK
jgi:hypothetical protein